WQSPGWQPPISTPSAPSRNAARTNCGATRPEHMSRMARTFGAYCIREIPARSAAVYVHQVQKNATIRGSKGRSVSDILQHPLDLREDLRVGEQVLLGRARRARTHADPAPLAHHLVDGGLLPVLVERDRAERAEADAGLAARARRVVDERRARLERDVSAVDHRERLRRRRAGLRDAVGDVLGALAGTGQEDAVGERRHGGELRVAFGEEALRAARDVEQPADFLGIGLRLDPDREDHHVDGDPPDRADEGILGADDQVALLLGRGRLVGHTGHAPADHVHALPEDLVVELLVALSGRAHVDVEVVDLGADAFLHHVRELERVHAADLRAPQVVLGVARAHAVDDPHGARARAVPEHDLAVRRAGGVQQALDLQAGVDVGIEAVPVLGHPGRVEGPVPGREDDRTDLDLVERLGLLEVERVALARIHARPRALPGLEPDARLAVDDHDRRRRLWEGDVDRLALGQALVPLVLELA